MKGSPHDKLARLRATAILCLLIAGPTTDAAGRRIALVLDTSRSMIQNDSPRYTVQATKILADLVSDGDALDAVHMPSDWAVALSSWSGGPCDMRGDAQLEVTLSPGRNAEFKAALDRRVRYDRGTQFAAPLRTAARFLNGDPAAERLLLVVADEGGLGECESVLTPELLALRRSGVLVAHIHLGAGASAFRGHPAFALPHAAPNAMALVEAIAGVYQRFLGGEHVQTGPLQGVFSVDVLPGATEAFVVVSLDGELAALEIGPGHPAAVDIDANYRGGGSTVGLDGLRRSYRIVRLLRPKAGRWTFRLHGTEGGGGWLLIQDYGVPHRAQDVPVTPDPSVPTTPPSPPPTPEPAPSGGGLEPAPTPEPVPSDQDGIGRPSPSTVPASVKPVRFRRLGARARATATLDLGGEGLYGPQILNMTSDLVHFDSILEIRTAEGWKRLGREPLPVALTAEASAMWPLRLQTGRCPQACAARSPHVIEIDVPMRDEPPRRLQVPLVIELVGVSRLRCYGPTLLGLLLLVVGLAGAWVFLAPRGSRSRLPTSRLA